MPKRGKVVVAMSGGVDSSVAAALLRKEGYEVIGVFMRLGTPPGVQLAETCDPTSGKSHKQGCCSVLDADDARRVSAVLDIPFYVLNFQEDFGRVINYFVDEYNRGRTPNPCVRCNDWLKFGKLSQYAKAVGADFVASGHYARTENVAGQTRLYRGKDLKKDQSYVLFGISREELVRTLLPIGQFEKSHVRAMAEELGLPVFNKPDSQEICFVPNQDYAALVRRRTPERFSSGEFVDDAGRVVGEHEGHQHFTVGQRKGLGVALGYPVYVTQIDSASNRVMLGPAEALLHASLKANQLNLHDARLLAGESVSCSAKIRYNHQPQPATAQMIGADELLVRFDQPQSAITPGQAVVLYDQDLLLGGGWIQSSSD